MRQLLVISAAIVTLVGAADTVQASPIVYTDRALWLAAANNVVNFDYSNLPAFGTQVNGIAEGDFTMTTGTQNYLYSWGAQSGYNLGTGNYLLGAPSLYCSQGQDCYTHEVFFAGQHAAAGSDVGLYAQTGTVTFSGTTHNGSLFSFSEVVTSGHWGFLGVVVDVGDWVTSMQYRSDNGSQFFNLILDNTAYGDVAAPATVPEPASLVLLGTGLAAFARARRKSR